MTGWRLSKWRYVAHYITQSEDGKKLVAKCGTFWWKSDGITSSDGTNARRCKRCARRVK